LGYLKKRFIELVRLDPPLESLG